MEPVFKSKHLSLRLNYKILSSTKYCEGFKQITDIPTYNLIAILIADEFRNYIRQYIYINTYKKTNILFLVLNELQMVGTQNYFYQNAQTVIDRHFLQ